MKKLLLLILIIVGGLTATAQDTTLLKNGYAIEFDSIYVVVDTVNQVSVIYNHYTQPVRLQINDSKPFRFEGYVIVHYVKFDAVVSRKKWFKIYRI